MPERPSKCRCQSYSLPPFVLLARPTTVTYQQRRKSRPMKSSGPETTMAHSPQLSALRGPQTHIQDMLSTDHAEETHCAGTNTPNWDEGSPLAHLLPAAVVPHRASLHAIGDRGWLIALLILARRQPVFDDTPRKRGNFLRLCFQAWRLSLCACQPTGIG